MAELIKRFNVKFTAQENRFAVKFTAQENWFNAKFSVVQIVEIPPSPADYYEGAYTIRPKTVDVIIHCREKKMHNDVTVEEIPIQYVSNPDGGKTAIIGG